jgi:hypothetical protein
VVCVRCEGEQIWGARVTDFKPTYLGSSSSGGGDSDQRTQCLVNGLTLTDGSVDKVEQLCVRVACEEIRDFLWNESSFS